MTCLKSESSAIKELRENHRLPDPLGRMIFRASWGHVVNHLEMDQQNAVEPQTAPEAGVLSGEGPSNASETFPLAMPAATGVPRALPPSSVPGTVLCYFIYI